MRARPASRAIAWSLLVALSTWGLGSCGGVAPARAPQSTDGSGRPAGFGVGRWRTTSTAGVVVDFCAWEADGAAQRGRGLMGVTDMGACPAMAFRYDEPVEQRFYMLGTPMALSIAWFGADGGFVSTTDMAPCPPQVAAAACPRYSSAGPYTVGVEVPVGGLAALGLVAGARLERLGDQNGL